MDTPRLKIGWAQADITPPLPVLLCGQFHMRVAEGVHDPLTATVLVLDDGDDQAVFVSCDLLRTSDELKAATLDCLGGRAKGLDAGKVILHATHTHTGPELRLGNDTTQQQATARLMKIDALEPAEYIRLAGGRIADAVAQAWNSRSPGSIAYGMDYAVIGRNRRWANTHGVSTMLGQPNVPEFSHVEGYEDHSVGIIATRDAAGLLTGIVVNLTCPSQVYGGEYLVSADFWHDARQLLRQKYGRSLHVLTQCGTAGDQCPHLLYDKKAHQRMLDLVGRTERQEYGLRVADAVTRAMRILSSRTDATGPLRHHVGNLQLPAARISEQEMQQFHKQAQEQKQVFEDWLLKLDADPSLRNEPRWYNKPSRAAGLMAWSSDVVHRYLQQQNGQLDTWPCEMHVVRLGDIALASNPFEYYLDFGVFIKVRSKAVQTFLVQLAGPGTYVPTLRSVQGGGYGSTAASNPVGPEGGRMLAEATVERINEMWE